MSVAPTAHILRTVIRDMRIARGLTQKQAAGRLRKPQSYITKLETGSRRIEVIEFLELLAALETDFAKVFAALEAYRQIFE